MEKKTDDKETFLSEYFKDGYCLVVDDDKSIRLLITKFLKNAGVANVAQADDGVPALEILKNPAHPNLSGIDNQASGKCLLLLIDWNMPRLSGKKLAKKIREDIELKNFPIVMISSETNRVKVIEAIDEAKLDGYIVKPFAPNQLTDKIFNILKQRSDPSDPAICIMEAEKLMADGEYDIAINVLNLGLEVSPGRASMLVLLGNAYKAKGENEKAKECYSRAKEINPNYLKVYEASADLSLKEGNEEEALSELKKAAFISPASSKRQTNIGEIYLKKGDTAKAEEIFKTMLKHNPENIEKIAEAYLNNNDFEKAEEYFRQALPGKGEKLNPQQKEDLSRIVRRLCKALEKQKKAMEAIKACEEAIMIAPDDERLHCIMGKAWMFSAEKTKDPEHLVKAKECFQKALAINPEYEEAKAALREV